MKRAILLATFMLVLHQTKGQTSASVTCNSNHTVSIVISNVDDVEFWDPPEWRTSTNTSACEPKLDAGAETVTYEALYLPDCAYESNQKDGEVQYILKISAEKVAGDSATGQLRTYDHLYYVTCNYDNTGRAFASFVPIKNRAANDTGNGTFTFSLMAYKNAAHTLQVPNPVALDVEIFFKAKVETQSGAPNLDLFLEECYSSKSDNPDSLDGKFSLIKKGCGSSTVSKDLDNTLVYSCVNDNTSETFSLKTYRYFGADPEDDVYIHCDFRVCLADVTGSACECPSDPVSCTGSRRRRSIYDSVDESQLYHVVYGPFTFKQEELNNDEVASKDQKETGHPFQTVAIVGAVCGVVAVAVICATVYLVVRYRSKRTQSGDLHVVT